MKPFWRRNRRTAGALGKRAARDFGEANVMLSAVQAAPLPTPPLSFGHGKMFSDWGMLGNDVLGDCAIAGPDHEHMCWTGIGNRGALSAKFTKATAVRDYSDCSGYVPGDPSTDNGTDVSHLMDYRRTTGMLDASGARHKIDLAVRLGSQSTGFDWNQFRAAVWAFKVVAIGFLVPYSAMQQFNEGLPWSYTGDQNIDGGHYVPAVGSPDSSQCAVITWGQRQLMDRDFFEAYVDELWVPLSEEAMASIETALHAVDWAAVETVAKGL